MCLPGWTHSAGRHRRLRQGCPPWAPRGAPRSLLGAPPGGGARFQDTLPTFGPTRASRVLDMNQSGGAAGTWGPGRLLNTLRSRGGPTRRNTQPPEATGRRPRSLDRTHFCSGSASVPCVTLNFLFLSLTTPHWSQMQVRVSGRSVSSRTGVGSPEANARAELSRCWWGTGPRRTPDGPRPPVCLNVCPARRALKKGVFASFCQGQDAKPAALPR